VWGVGAATLRIRLGLVQPPTGCAWGRYSHPQDALGVGTATHRMCACSLGRGPGLFMEMSVVTRCTVLKHNTTPDACTRIPNATVTCPNMQSLLAYTFQTTIQLDTPNHGPVQKSQTAHLSSQARVLFPSSPGPPIFPNRQKRWEIPIGNPCSSVGPSESMEALVMVWDPSKAWEPTHQSQKVWEPLPPLGLSALPTVVQHHRRTILAALLVPQQD